MKAKTTFLFVLTLLIVSSVSILSGFAQHTTYTQLSLPAGAKARLGKGSIEEVTYSPDGSLLAVGSNIGIWLYDTKTYRELALLAGQMDWVYSLAFSPDGTILARRSLQVQVMIVRFVCGTSRQATSKQHSLEMGSRSII